MKIHLVKEKGSLGIEIAGGKNSSKGDVGIFVAELDEGSPAARLAYKRLSKCILFIGLYWL